MARMTRTEPHKTAQMFAPVPHRTAQHSINCVRSCAGACAGSNSYPIGGLRIIAFRFENRSVAPDSSPVLFSETFFEDFFRSRR